MIRIEIGFDGRLERVITDRVTRLNFMIDQVDQRPASCDVTGELNAVEKPPAILRRRQEIIVDDGGVTRLTATEPNVSDGDGGHHSRRQRERSAGRTLRVTAI